MDNSYQVAVAKGCLGGIALALAWALTGALLYYIGLLGGAEQKVALVCGIAGGPVVISVAALGWVWWRGQQRAADAGQLKATEPPPNAFADDED